MKSGRIGGGLADCLFVCQPFVFRKTECLFVASQKLQNISFFRTSRGDCGEKRPGAHHCLVCSGPFLLQIPRVCQQDASFYPVSQRTAKSRFLKGMSGVQIYLLPGKTFLSNNANTVAKEYSFTVYRKRICPP